MNNKKKTASSVTTTGSGNGKIPTPPIANYTKDQPRKQGIVEQHLLKGSENAITGADLAKLIGCSSIRYLRSMISAERQNGALILSSPSGYFLPSDGEKGREEIQRFIAQFRALALNTLKALKTAKQALSVVEGQYSLLEGDD